MSSSDTWRHILCADWAKGPAKRAVCHADVQTRRLELVERFPWTLAALLDFAETELDGSVLIGIDAVIGVQESYLRQAPGWREGMTFLDWLPTTQTLPHFFEAATEVAQLAAERPFFAVPTGVGGRRRFEQAATWEPRRRVEEALGGNPVFIVRGIPGSVGSASLELWRELRKLLPDPQRRFRVWPFEGDLDALGQTDGIVLAEGYPKAAYGTALASVLPAAPRKLSKSRREARDAAFDALSSSPWIDDYNVQLPEREAVTSDDDRFDATLMAAAWLRCVLQGHPLVAQPVDREAEGGIVDTSGSHRS